ncbi:autotransporter outer membrane beta-barrel domain-containing protein [Pseudomonas sp. UMAB-08]|uniref:autotransporter outer membrane beta-barrel domain-containing protein n=1 Tax=Pseudomonas sp. UMAB-08 TaxID=1365375 RepID=UPI001C5865F7|nr:autotransporter outer membrane beta-barrel domain-containing protein [Pseudomonas sp. UMAB-08]
MPRSIQYTYAPLARALKMISIAPFMVMSSQGLATPITGDRTIDSSYAVDSYEVSAGGILTANGANTYAISALDSTIYLNHSVVTATSAFGVTLTGSKATIVGGSVSGTGTGLRLNSGGLKAASADVSGSKIMGGVSGALIGEGNSLTLHDTQVTGTNEISTGIQVFGATLKATSSTIIGGTNGMSLRSVSASTPASTVTLDDTKVVGQNGSAIVVRGDAAGGGIAANITVSNGSSLTGGNGVMLDVQRGGVLSLAVNNSALTGNIQLTGNSTAKVTLDQSTMLGDVTAEAGSTANVVLKNQSVLTGRLENVASLSVNSNAQWVMIGDGSVADVSMNGGSIKFGDPTAFHTLSVGTLSGSGTFVMDANFATGQADFLNVTGTASGNHNLLIGSSGNDPLTDNRLHVVHIAGGDAQFSLLNGPVDLGTFSYGLTQRGDDWYLNTQTRAISPGARSVLALFNAAPTVWYGELSTLRSRMGEVRMDAGKTGGWIRAYGNKYNVSAVSGTGYQQTQQGISFGADAPLPVGDGQWLAGLMGGYSKSDLDLQRGTSGTVDSYYVGAYTTWLDEQSGYYFDGVLKFNRFQNESSVALSDGHRAKGDYDNNGVGASLEFGRHITLDNDYFIEPYTQLSGVIIQGKDYNLDNGLSGQGDRTGSLLGKLGSTAGRNFNMGNGQVIQPYVRIAYVHEFADTNKVHVNDNVFNNDLSGSRGELGTGIAVSLADRLQVHADFDYSNGDNIEQPWGANVGVRYSW